MNTNRPKNKSGQSGFTLIEQMICVAIIGIMAAPMLNAYLDSKKFAEDQIRFTRVAAALEKQMEILKTTNFSKLKNVGNGALDADVVASLAEVEGATGAVKISDSTYPYVKRIEVEIKWKNPFGAEKSLKSVALRAAP